MATYRAPELVDLQVITPRGGVAATALALSDKSFAIRWERRSLPGMAAHPASPFRLVVKARTPIGRKSGFVWEIIRKDTDPPVVSRSSVSYGSMEEAYEHGAIEVTRLREKAQ
jgi:hypothetical protein